MKALIRSLLIVTVAVFVVSVPCIPERCLACNRRVCPIGRAESLRLMSVVEWVHDASGDIHCNGLCPTLYAIINGANNE